MKFIVLVALFAVAAADSYRPAEYAPKYETPNYQTTRYEEAKYETAEPYDFSWAVKDEASYNDFDHSESSDGKVTTGVYRVELPDGRTQIVTYRADYYGYTADVKYIGEAKYPEYVQSNYKASTYSAPTYKPSTPTYQHSTPTYKPSTPTYKPSTPTYKPSTTTYKPSTTTYKPSTPTYQPPTPTYKPYIPTYNKPTYTAAPAYKTPMVQPKY